MNKILFINACVRENSRTYTLAQKTVSLLDGTVSEVRTENILPLNSEGLRLREENLAKENFDASEFELAREFSEADEIVIAAPYWDLSHPASLKAYLEQICICGITFSYGDGGIPKGMCNAKRLIYVTTAGGYIGDFNFGFDYVSALAKGLFGIKETLFFSAEGLDIHGHNPEKILKTTEKEITKKL